MLLNLSGSSMSVLSRLSYGCLFCSVVYSSAAWSQFTYDIYHGSFDALPNFTTLTPVLTGTADTVGVSVRDVDNNFALVFSNQLTVTQAATYEFRTTSDDGSKLFVENILVVDNDGLHAPLTVTGQIFLNPGSYTLRIEFFEKGGGETLDVLYRVAGNPFAQIPADGQLSGVVLNEGDIGVWGPVITWPHIAISAANLPDGRVLTWSSTETNAFPANREFTHSAVFDPTNNTFQNTDSNFHDMFCAGVSTLESGVIVASGGNPDDSRTSMFDPNSLTWSPLSNMNDRRWYGTNITLPNNRIFSTFAKTAGNRSEVFDPGTNVWTRTANADMQTLVNEQNAINAAANPSGALNLEWWAHMAITPEGRVFQGGPTPTFHLFDPIAGGANQVLGQMTGGRARMYGNAVTYDVGKVLLVGGADRRENQPTTTANAYTVDLNSPTPIVTQAAPMNYARALSNSVTLPNGEVLVVGGNTVGKVFNDSGSVFPAEIYNPATNTWRVVDDIDVPRNYHSTALLLKDGRVLSAGGGACGGCAVNHLDGQIFSPPYLFDSSGNAATRPTLSVAPAQIIAGQQSTVTASDDTTRFSMVRLSSTTHHLNTDQRFVPITMQDNGGGTFTLDFNANPNVLLLGNYWLFAINANGTPSIGRTIQVINIRDSDGDGVIDSEDVFPNDPTETVDTDSDGVGDNADVFPADPNETHDSDGDGVGDNADSTPHGDATTARYVRLTALSEINGKPWTSAAEINVVGMDGLALDRTNWTATATSEEFNSENGRVSNVLDGDNNTIWHTDWSTNAGDGNDPPPPHLLTIDMRAVNAVTGLSYLPRPGNGNGTIRQYEIHISSNGINWGTPIASGEFADPGVNTVIFPVSEATNITPLPESPRNSSTILVENSTGSDRIWNVNPDNNSVSVSNVSGNLIQEISVGANPWALAKAPNSNRVFVTNKIAASISIINTDTLMVEQTISVPFNSQPHGIVFNSTGSEYYVVLEARARVEKRNASSHAVIASMQLTGTPRHIATKYNDSRLLVSNFITPPIPGESTATVDTQSAGAEVFVIDSASMVLARTIELTHDNRGLSESAGPGLPNYMNAPVISFDDQLAYVPSKKDNINSGTLRGNPGMTFDSTVRANGSRITLDNEAEDSTFRIDFDNASVATGAALTGDSRYLLTALETSRELSVYDTLNNFELMRLPTGRAPQGVALSTSGSIAYVHNFMDRSISRFDLTEMLESELPFTNVLPPINVVNSETLTATVLNGKQLFYDAADDRLSRDNYMSCASCHNDGDSDGRVWDMSSFGEGLRKTISLQGKGSGHGVLHWTGNFDEVQDFEGQIRSLSLGTGLMSQADFNNTSDPLGSSKAGLSGDLDALAAYVNSLTETPASPFRASSQTMSAEALAGRSLFASKSCSSCHAGAASTDSAQQLLHDIGTIDIESGNRLNATLTGFDTPTILGIWKTPPYMHDGSAQTIGDAISQHNTVALTADEISKLGTFIREVGTGDLDLAIDTDGDGVIDSQDAFPNDPTETVDTDGDGVGDNSDAFPSDPSEAQDTDGDGVGDNADVYPNDPTETTDTDGDGVGDNSDAFPNDPTRWLSGSAQTIEVRVGASADDAEEKPSGSVSLTSSDLELTTDGSQIQWIGMRFTGLNIPVGAVITNAWMQFQTDETSSITTQLTIRAQAADNPQDFSSVSGNISSRTRTNNEVDWNVAPWPTANEAGPAQRSPGLASVIQEVVSRPGWQSGQAMVMIIGGSGKRTAESFNGNAAAAPLLHIEYSTDGELPTDSDGDGVPDATDVFPNDPLEWVDADGDGVGDNRDAFPNDSTRWLPGGAQAIDVRVSTSTDDAEEKPSGAISLSSSDLELTTDGSQVQLVGMRFTGLNIPAGVLVTDAWIQFQADETSSVTTQLTIRAQAADDAAGFSSVSGSISSRTRTNSGVAWNVAPWPTKDEAGPAQRSPGLAAVIQEVVSRPGWQPGQAMVVIIGGAGKRTAESFNGNASAAPLLHVEYASDGEPPVDSDGDGVPDSSDAFPNDPTEWVDTDGDGVGDNVDAYPNDPTRWELDPNGTQTLEIRVNSSANDAEEKSTGSVSLSSSDLELTIDRTTTQQVGIRFTGLTIPVGASISSAWIQFQTDEVSTGATSLTIRAQAADNPPVFRSVSRNISSRPRTTRSSSWIPAPWPARNEAGPAQRSPNIAAVLQEVVSRAGWQSGNAVVFLIEGSGRRTAEAFNGNSSAAPLLHIEFTE